MLIQCTKKLLDELKIKPEENTGEDPLFSWHGNLITLNRRKTLVLVNDKNRYVIVLYGLKAKDFKNLHEHIIKAIKETFKEEYVKDSIIEDYINSSKNIVYSKTKDRSSVARMNKSCDAAYYYVESLDTKSFYQPVFSKKLSRYLVGNGKEYITPSKELFEDLQGFANTTIFSTPAMQIMVTLDLPKHKVWRRIILPINMTFSRFHNVLQKAFGWRDYHLHEFYVYERIEPHNNTNSIYMHHPHSIKGFLPIVNLISLEDEFDIPNSVETRLETHIKLSEYIPKYKRILYHYDFGDSWEHHIVVEKIIEDYDKNYAVCINGEGDTPPEDVGGSYGYLEFFEIMRNPQHPDYKNLKAWAESQGYKEFNLEQVNRELRFLEDWY